MHYSGGGAAKGASLALETLSGVSVRNDGLICISLTVHPMLIHIYLFFRKIIIHYNMHYNVNKA